MTHKVYKSENVAYILITGPEPYQDSHGDEQPIWHLFYCDSDDNEIIYTSFFTYEALVKTGEKIARKLNVPFENEASPA